MPTKHLSEEMKVLYPADLKKESEKDFLKRRLQSGELHWQEKDQRKRKKCNDTISILVNVRFPSIEDLRFKE